jgi:hypothetical protein
MPGQKLESAAPSFSDWTVMVALGLACALEVVLSTSAIPISPSANNPMRANRVARREQRWYVTFLLLE